MGTLKALLKEGAPAIKDKLLDMTRRARMERAREMGFDTERAWYHGTENDVSSFKPQFKGRATDAPSARQGYFFTSAPNVASDYSELGEGRGIAKLKQNYESWERIAQRSGKSKDWDRYHDAYQKYEDAALNWFDETGGITEGSNVVPAHIRQGKQKVVDFGGDAYREESYNDILMQARGEGYDSVLLKNTIDPANPALDSTVQDIVVVFDPSNIRSVNAAFDPDKKTSANLLAGGAAAAVGLGAGSQDAEAGPISTGKRIVIEAFQGSPHRFPAERLIRKADGSEEFIVGAPDVLPDVPEGAEVLEDFPLGRHRSDKIGTGEGAQAYGYGHYFADSEGVARSYRDMLGGKDFTRFDRFTETTQEEMKSSLREYFENLQAYRGLGGASGYAMIGDEGIRKLDAGDFDSAIVDDLAVNSNRATEINKIVEGIADNQGALYRAHLEVDPDTLLDWDGYIHNQPEKVKRALVDAGLIDGISIDPEMVAKRARAFGEARGETGASLLARLEEKYREAGAINPKQMASKELQSLGIPGIRYLDGMSRNKGEGSYNYVMFDEKPIKIQERGAADVGLLGTIAGAGSAGLGALLAADKAFSESAAGQATGDALQFAFDAMELPSRYGHGVAAALGSLVNGASLSQALAEGARVKNQSIDEIARDLGEYTADKTGSPYAAALVDALTNVIALEP